MIETSLWSLARQFSQCNANFDDATKRVTGVKKVGSSNVSAAVRWEELNKHGFVSYPRMKSVPCTIAEFREKYEGDEKQDLVSGEVESENLVGRVQSIRKAGSKLAFITIAEQAPHASIQITLNEAVLQQATMKSEGTMSNPVVNESAHKHNDAAAAAEQDSTQKDSIVKSFLRGIGKGDFICEL